MKWVLVSADKSARLNPFIDDEYNITIIARVKNNSDVAYKNITFKEVDVSLESTLTANTVLTTSAAGVSATINTNVPTIDIGLGITKLGNYSAGTSRAFDPTKVNQQTKLTLNSDSDKKTTVYYGVWDQANYNGSYSSQYDNLNFITEVNLPGVYVG